MARKPGLMLDIIGGTVVGGIVAALVAVNVVIMAGFERGYETSIPEVFEESPLIGTTVVGLLVGGPILGVILARVARRRRTRRPE